MNVKEVLNWVEGIEKEIRRKRTNDTLTKFKTLKILEAIKKLVLLQIPMPPINISEDGYRFTCAHCGQDFESTWRADEVTICPECGQRWKETDKGEENE